MFDYLFAEQGLPWLQCPTCNMKIKFHGGWYPTELICQNCGQMIDVRKTLKKPNFSFPNKKYDKDGKYLIEEDIKNV